MGKLKIILSKIIGFIVAKIDTASLCDVIFIMLLGFKLAGIISCSWFIVFLPLIIYYAAIVLLYIGSKNIQPQANQEPVTQSGGISSDQAAIMAQAIASATGGKLEVYSGPNDMTLAPESEDIPEEN